MGAIKRQDGVTFITQAYRETLTQTRKSIITHEFRLLAEQHGRYACLRKRDNHSLEAAFDNEQGYLLGETVWHYFKKPDHLIYVEAVTNSAQLLLVIVRGGSVYFDAKITSSQLKDELTPLMTDSERYHVVVYGEVPLREKDTFGGATFILPKGKVSQFEQLTQPIFPSLPIINECLLQPLPLVIRSRYLQRQGRWWTTAGTVIFIVLMGWWIFFPHHNQQMQSLQMPKRQVLAPYQLALQSPEPAAQIAELTHKIDELYLIPGWRLSHIHYTGEQYDVTLKAQGGSLWYLTDWARQHYYDLRIVPNAAKLQLSSALPKRTTLDKLPAIQSTVDTVYDRMAKVLANNAVTMNTQEQHGDVYETKMVIRLTALSPELLDLIGQELSDLPLTLSSISVDIHNGLIDGQIFVSVWGQ